MGVVSENNVNIPVRLRIEILAASPPTSKCKHIINSMENLMEKYPDQLRLDIYYAGMQLTIKPTQGYQVEGKSKKIPCVFINGKCIANGEVPNFEEVEEVLKDELSKNSRFLQE